MISRKKNSASKLRSRVTLQQEVKTLDGAGGYVRSWQNIADLWAEIEIVDSKFRYGREIFYAGNMQSEVRHKITVRYRGDITTEMRLIYDGRIFNIRAAANIGERKEFLEILAEEGVGG